MTRRLAGVLVDLPANVAAGADHEPPYSAADRVRTLLTARFLAVLLFRCSAAVRSSLLAGLLKQVNQVITGADIAPDAVIGPGLVLYHPNGVVVGSGARIGDGAVLQQGVTIGGAGGPRRAGTVQTHLGHRVFLGAGARVIGAVEIGDDVVVGANAVVTKSVPSDSIAVGVPATVRPRR